jgi:tetratricopeptide (TPR) repeat protein
VAHGYLAEIYLAQGSLDQAYGHLVRMEEIDPDAATGQFLMARYCHERRNYQRARIYAEKVIDHAQTVGHHRSRA